MTDYKAPENEQEEINEIKKMILFIVENHPKYEIQRGTIFDIVASRMIMLGELQDIKHTYTRESYFVKALPKIITE